ncbi:hypothetical protein CONPUDRAFT_170153 [Coniophora puteana RWD-64-598 SS2]|uniref:Uncharacterized protein n=1 Tax=Coniophora puteana (strain RWD-64-598) TaxID=741705 RepID=R7SEZ1_CONPW|nr:uncharacterized protein CONPUDRAFT_170153 [Coniophora puteana RWD-64-598 SS2]EIW74445.1 hypothetical protein CONPUDRAFT_170153 [Coniophora puteana RWD-64-598 SS2]
MTTTASTTTVQQPHTQMLDPASFNISEGVHSPLPPSQISHYSTLAGALGGQNVSQALQNQSSNQKSSPAPSPKTKPKQTRQKPNPKRTKSSS